MIRLSKLWTPEEYHAANDRNRAKGLYLDDRSTFLPGHGVLMPWMFDPTYKEDANCARHDKYLSIHYWKDWADKRPPIMVWGPDGSGWIIDCKSSNGDGWIVTGEWPNISCSPSIVLRGYHGYLQNGQFGPDLDAATRHHR